MIVTAQELFSRQGAKHTRIFKVFCVYKLCALCVPAREYK